MTYERKNPEPELKNVCLLLIQRNNMVVVEPSVSKNLEDEQTIKVVKALSHKFADENKAEEALRELNKKYKLSGIFSPEEKIEMVKIFKIEGKTFHVFRVSQNRGNLNIEGNFRFVKIKDLLREVKIAIKGTGDCIITPSLKMALN